MGRLLLSVRMEPRISLTGYNRLSHFLKPVSSAFYSMLAFRFSVRTSATMSYPLRHPLVARRDTHLPESEPFHYCNDVGARYEFSTKLMVRASAKLAAVNWTMGRYLPVGAPTRNGTPRGSPR